MSLDQNLFTLLFAPGKDDPNVTELVDPSDTPHYRKERVFGDVYKINVYDPISSSLLASATAPSATSKTKVIELHNPSHVVELKYTGTLTFKWKFQWEEHEFEWKREECFIVRKPDPSVLVAVTKEPSGRLKTQPVQILDYNLNRFDINDRKGLEIVILTALLTFQDSNDAYHTPTPDSTPSLTSRLSFFGTTRRASDPAQASLTRQTSEVDAAPQLPPRPPPKTGVDRIAEMHAIRAAQGEGEANEIQVDGDGSVDDYAAYASRILADDAILFITIRSASAAEVPKVLHVVEQTKRLRHKAGMDEAQELFQYVVYDTAKRKGPRRIKLDDPGPAPRGYAPPESLSVHMSKIDLPELKPKMETPTKTRAVAADPPRPLTPPRSPREEKGKTKGKDKKVQEPTPPPSSAEESDKGKGKGKDKGKPEETRKEKALRQREEREREKELQREKEREREREKERARAQQKAEKEAKKAEQKNKKSSSTKPEVNKLTRPTVATTIPTYQPIPTQPLPPQHLYQSPTSPSYQPPPSPSFPQPYSSHQRPASAFYSGVSFPANMPPPVHPSVHSRPPSYYGPGAFQNSGVTPGFNPGFLQP